MIRTYSGQCHCGAVKVEHISAIAPAAAEIRECQCSFCRMHGARAVSDPNGRLRFSELRPGALQHYRFGLATADFLVCSQCGVYVGCVLTDGDDSVGIVNIRTLEDNALFTSQPIAADYDGEQKSDRVTRRLTNWTPAVMEHNP